MTSRPQATRDDFWTTASQPVSAQGVASRRTPNLVVELLERVASIPVHEALISRRGFEVTDQAKAARIEKIGHAFIGGYNASISACDLSHLQSDLEQVESDFRGFTYEGASMGLAVGDFIFPFFRRWNPFLQAYAGAYVYLFYVGRGWALARLPVSKLNALAQIGSPLGWLAIDGFGFHQGYFHWRKYILEPQSKPRPQGYIGRAFDQGLGRSLWFVCGADPGRIASALGRFEHDRLPDLWAGVGLAATYASGASRTELGVLRSLAGEFFPQIAQGAVFAAEARHRGRNVTEDTEVACEVLCGISSDKAAQLARTAFPTARHGNGDEIYEIWRGNIRTYFVT